MKYNMHTTRRKGRTYVTARLIVEKVLGRQLKGSEEVHHADGNPQNNLNSNLVLCPNRAYHMLLHIRMESVEITGDPNNRKCNICLKWDKIENLRSSKNSNGQPRYWHRACAAEYQRNLYQRKKAVYGQEL
mgnify:CR=1 FL=1